MPVLVTKAGQAPGQPVWCRFHAGFSSSDAGWLSDVPRWAIHCPGTDLLRSSGSGGSMILGPRIPVLESGGRPKRRPGHPDCGVRRPPAIASRPQITEPCLSGRRSKRAMPDLDPFGIDAELYDLSMSEGAKPLLTKVKNFMADYVEPITEEYYPPRRRAGGPAGATARGSWSCSTAPRRRPGRWACGISSCRTRRRAKA